MAAVTVVLLGVFGLLFVRSSENAAKKAWFIVFVVVVGGGVSIMSAHSFVAKWAFKGDAPRDGLVSLMDGTAYRPYVYRRLAPDIVRWSTDYLLPRLPQNKLDYLRDESFLGRYRWTWGGAESWNDRKAIAFHVAYFLTWASTFGALVAGACLWRALRRCSWLEAVVTASLVVSLLPLIFIGGGYVYDAPEFLLWTALLNSVVRRWFWTTVPLFGLMLANKESALLVVPALYPMFASRGGPRAAVAWCGALGALGVGWLWFVRARYAWLPGQPMEWWLRDNLEFWANPKSYLSFSQLLSPGSVSPRGANLLNLLLLLVPLRFGWRATPRDLRLSTGILAAELFPLFFACGRADELRGLSLLFPLVLIVALSGVHAMFRSPERPVAVDGT